MTLQGANYPCRRKNHRLNLYMWLVTCSREPLVTRCTWGISTSSLARLFFDLFTYLFISSFLSYPAKVSLTKYHSLGAFIR